MVYGQHIAGEEERWLKFSGLAAFI
ncbi:hypothetical protein ACFX19_034979 [Malus domestica]